MAEFFGEIERGLARLYPYRWPILFGILLVVTGVAAYSYRTGWHLNVWRHRVSVAIVGTPALAAVLVVGWYLGSPLFTSKTVIEEFSFAFVATVPSTMTQGDVEKTMASIAKFDEKVSEGMLLSTTGATAAAKIKSGSFCDADDFHKVSGEATIYRGPDGSRLLRLENLSVTNGPALHVILSPHSGPDTSGEVESPGYVDLDRLKGNKGDQNYPIPDDVDSQMSVVFSVAMLHDGMETSVEVMIEDALEAAETAVAQQASVVKLKTGNFRDAESFHRGSAQATIYRGPDGSRVLRLENLDVTNGPDLHVIITPHGNPTRGSEVKTTGYRDLGKLNGNKGNQNYPIPDDVDISDQRTVVMYCVPFGVVFSTAVLQDVNWSASL